MELAASTAVVCPGLMTVVLVLARTACEDCSDRPTTIDVGPAVGDRLGTCSSKGGRWRVKKAVGPVASKHK